MSTHKEIVEKYITEVADGDLELGLSFLAEDVLFDFVGQARIQGRAELESTIRSFSANSGGSTTHTIERLIEEGDTVVVTGRGASIMDGQKREFVFSDVFTFRGDMISSVETYQVQTSGPGLESVWDDTKSASA